MQDIIRPIANLSGVFLLVKVYHNDAPVDNMLQYLYENSDDIRACTHATRAFGACGTCRHVSRRY